MTRKDDLTKRQIDHQGPHQVTVRVQLRGLGVQLLQMNDFCHERAMPFRSQTHHRDDGDFMRYCFAEPTHAAAFADKFGGERSTVVINDNRRD
jgi:hypothetical protein